MLVKREAPGFSVPIHVGNILLNCLIIQSEPDTIIIVDLWETSNRAEPCPPVTANTALARASEAAEPIVLMHSTNQLNLQRMSENEMRHVHNLNMYVNAIGGCQQGTTGPFMCLMLRLQHAQHKRHVPRAGYH